MTTIIKRGSSRRSPPTWPEKPGETTARFFWLTWMKTLWRRRTASPASTSRFLLTSGAS